jgi:predicted nucleotide-binding protein
MIGKQVASGEELQLAAEAIDRSDSHEEWRERWSRWRKFTSQTLNAIYSTSEASEEFEKGPGIGFISLGERSLREKLAENLEDLRRELNNLRSLEERLVLVPVAGAPEESSSSTSDSPTSETAVFVVHGHEEQIKEKVVRQLETAGGHPVKVLHEQADEGKTLIEKFERHASLSGFAVILLTPDDLGAKASDIEKAATDGLRPRARQNVIFELGYFVGAFGRERVAVLYDQTVELPSDYQGVAYISLADETWRYRLLKELRAANFDYDLNRIL